MRLQAPPRARPRAGAGQTQPLGLPRFAAGSPDPRGRWRPGPKERPPAPLQGQHGRRGTRGPLLDAGRADRPVPW
eukprot:632514-Lingulodinium_polyedra.AAC.1